MSTKFGFVFVLFTLSLLYFEVSGQDNEFIAGVFTLGGGLAVDSIKNAFECSQTAGCQRGYCWAWCGVSLSGGEWCYTTRTYSQSFNYVSCNSDSDCDPCWKCAGSCTV